MSNKIPQLEQFIPEAVCLACTGCCRFSCPDTPWSPRLLKEETERFLENNVPPAILASEGKIRLESRGEECFICSLFEPAGNSCTVYAFRPFECRLYPFLINRRENKVFVAVDTGCPFVQKKLNSKEFKEYQRLLVDFLNTPAILMCLKDNPQIIQSYANVLDLSELNL